MNRLAHTIHNRMQRKARVRSTVVGTKDRPRLSVFISNRHITAQIVNDETGTTLAYVSTVGNKQATGSLTQQASLIGGEIAKKAKAAKIKRVVLDRGSRLYHGRIKTLADSARENGLEF